MMINNKMEAKTVVKLRKIAKKVTHVNRMSTKFATLQRKLPLVYEVALCSFWRAAFSFWDRFLFFEKLKICFFLEKIAFHIDETDSKYTVKNSRKKFRAPSRNRTHDLPVTGWML